jgi:signal transduction histidine kinase
MSDTRSSLNLSQKSSYHQTRVFLFAGFGGLLLLMIVMGLSAISSMYQIELRERNIREQYLVRDRAIESLRSNTYLSGTYIRDFLLADSDRLAEASKEHFRDQRRRIESVLNEYRNLVTEKTRDAFGSFTAELNQWFGAIDPVLIWDAATRKARGYRFEQDQVLPMRSVVLDSVDRLQQLAEQDLEQRSEDVSAMVAALRTRLMILTGLTVLTGAVLAGLVLWRLLRLEDESMLRFQEVLRTREELKRLSAELLSAQETERRRISRELHDEVGQVLSAIAFGLGNARSALKDHRREEVFVQIQQLLEMIERNIGVVRNIALLLRPTMLDDLGLAPALRWLAKEFTRTTPTHVDLAVEEFPEDLPEEHRTCIFRVVQEAVRNSVRHSGATRVRISLRQAGSEIRASVQDDGKGFQPGREKGLGMIGMEERVMHLGGRLRVDSEAGRGTIVSFELPLARGAEGGEDGNEDQAQISPLRTA